MPESNKPSVSSLITSRKHDDPILSEVPSPAPIIKRKREEDDGEVQGIKKAAKKRKSKKRMFKEDSNMNLDQGLNLAIGRLDSRLLADHVAQRTKRFATNLSTVELDDIHIPEKAFLDTSEWNTPRTLQDLPSFLDRYCSGAGRNLACASKISGSPHTLVITSAGLRAADLTRALRTFQTKDSTVAKLFAKHIKLSQAIDYVKKTRMGIGVGTPSRIIDLLDAGALISSKLERVVVDCSHIDQKKRGIFDMRETQQPLMLLLNRPELRSRYGGGRGDIQLVFY